MASLSALQDSSQTLSLQVVSCDERAARAEADLRIEREWRQSLQEKEVKLKENISSLQLNIKKLNEEGNKHDRVRNELDRAKKQWSEAQTTLEELGIQLSVSKLQVSELQEKVRTNDLNGSRSGNDAGAGGGVWTPDYERKECKGCQREFSMSRRKVRRLSNRDANAITDGIKYFSFVFSIIAEIAVIFSATIVQSKLHLSQTKRVNYLSQFESVMIAGKL